MVGFVGDLSTDTTYAIAQLVGVLSYPQPRQSPEVSVQDTKKRYFLQKHEGDVDIDLKALEKDIASPNYTKKKGRRRPQEAGPQKVCRQDTHEPNLIPEESLIQSFCAEHKKVEREAYNLSTGRGKTKHKSDAPKCFKCSEYQMSNIRRTGCISKTVNFLSYKDTLGASLASIALVLFLTTSAVQGIFVKYWETPIVRANNQNLSCLLLISLMLCFLCTLLFIGRPTQICCLLRQVTFGIVFTISVSSVLAKTLTVIIAFNATKPGSKLKKYVGTQLAILLVLMCTLGKIGISVVWMVSNPPFLEADTFSEMDTIILLCNEGSVTFFFCIIGYIGTLALLSFIAAFLAKDFPDRFNEAKNITFSMLGFCSVWGAFVPAYLSSKGSRMVAVEIFAILASSAGLLACIFVPKCFIIFFRPKLNKRANVLK
ncbi:hypothetical protein XENTR_v10015232 [Xenopus tropicalis]|nr:hypothetical protein XENTR_v10015232 [Xenopus tropicalis]